MPSAARLALPRASMYVRQQSLAHEIDRGHALLTPLSRQFVAVHHWQTDVTQDDFRAEGVGQGTFLFPFPLARANNCPMTPTATNETAHVPVNRVADPLTHLVRPGRASPALVIRDSDHRTRPASARPLRSLQPRCS